MRTTGLALTASATDLLGQPLELHGRQDPLFWSQPQILPEKSEVHVPFVRFDDGILPVLLSHEGTIHEI